MPNGMPEHCKLIAQECAEIDREINRLTNVNNSNARNEVRALARAQRAKLQNVDRPACQRRLERVMDLRRGRRLPD
jgi:hypothetical protein